MLVLRHYSSDGTFPSKGRRTNRRYVLHCAAHSSRGSKKLKSTDIINNCKLEDMTEQWSYNVVNTKKKREKKREKIIIKYKKRKEK